MICYLLVEKWFSELENSVLIGYKEILYPTMYEAINLVGDKKILEIEIAVKDICSALNSYLNIVGNPLTLSGKIRRIISVTQKGM